MKKLLFWVLVLTFIQKNTHGGNGYPTSKSIHGVLAVSSDSTPDVTIGTQIWTSKNLSVPTFRNGDPIPEVTNATEWSNLTTGAWCWYNNDSATYAATCGRLYNWYALNDPRGLAPAGYHVPSSAEWNLLNGYLSPNAGVKLKSTTGWNPDYDEDYQPIVNTNSSGFSAIASGCRSGGYFSYLGVAGNWWSTDKSTTNAVLYISIYKMESFNNLLSNSNQNKSAGLSVRLIKDAITCTPNTGDTTASVNNSFEWYGNTYTTSATPTHTFTNVGGCDSVVTLHLTILYPDVTIGTQIWTSKNLSVPTYRNGDLIPEVTDANTWGNLTTGAWCWYNNDSATYAATYGRMYNWYAVNDPRGLAPTGYHIPTDGEWTMLSEYLGPDEAIKMKSTSGWAISNVINGNGTNTSGFSALPGASRYYYEDQQDWYFGYLFFSGTWWSTDAVNDANAKSRRIQYFGNNSLISSNSTKAMGMHVRLIKGEAITCTPNTGDTTATACGSFEWYGTTYTSSATPTHTFTNVGGCDSVVTLHLNISNINVSFTGDTLLFTIADCGENITDFHTSISNDILTITAANASNSIALASDIPSGITSNNASYVAVDLASIQNFSGVKILGGTGTDIVTIGSNGVDLSAIGYGNSNQSFTAILNSANDSLIVDNTIKAKGFGNIYLQSVKGISLNAPLTASLDSISLISEGNVYQTAALSSKYLSLGYGVRLEDACASTDISNNGNYILTNAANAIDTLIACTNGSVTYNDLDNVVETFARIAGDFTLAGGGNLKVAACGIVSTSAQSNINISSTGGSVSIENTGIRTNGDVMLNSATSSVSSDNFGIVSNGKVTITASGNVSSNSMGIDNNLGKGIDIKSLNGTVNINGNGIKSKDTIVINAYGNITAYGNGVNNTAGTGKKLSIVSTAGTFNSNSVSSNGKITILAYGNVYAGGSGIQNGAGLGVDVTSTNGTVTVTDGGLTSNGVVNLLAVGNVIARGVNAYNAGNINITSTGGSVSTGYGGVQTQGKITILSYGDINTSDGGITNSNGTGVDFTSTNGGIAVRAAGLSSKSDVNFVAAGDIIATDGGMSLYNNGKLKITSTSGTVTISSGGAQTRGDIEIKAKRNVTISGNGLRNDNSSNGKISLQSDSGAVVVSSYSIVNAKNNLTVKANNVSLSSANALKSTGKKILIFPATANTIIDLGGVSTTGVLGISNAYLDYMTADTIAIGDNVNTSSILVSTKITDTVHSMVFVANPTGSITLTDSLRLKDVDVSAVSKYKTAITTTSSSNVLNVSGSVTLGSNTALDLSSSVTGFATGNTIKLINNENEDAVSGNFAGLNEGDTLSILDGAGSRVPLQISYVGGDGNDVVLTVFSLCTPNIGDTSATACGSFEWYGTTYTSSATPTHTFTNVGGCDSVVTLHLTIGYASTGDTSAFACGSFQWYGNTYTSSAAPTHTFTNVSGCDSVVTLHLTIGYANIGDTSAFACGSFEWYGTTYTSSATPTHTFTNVGGCDSVVTLHLTIGYANIGDTSAFACGSFEWYGNTYTSSTAPTHTFTNVGGCDSVVTLHLTIGYANTGDTSAFACSSFQWYGNTYTSSAAPTHTFTNVSGCDSVVTLHLTIGLSTVSTETISSCNSYTWHGTTYTTSNNSVTWKGVNAAGCDSIVTLHLTISTGTFNAETQVACDQYVWHSQTISVSGNYLYNYTNGNGCTSVDTLHLTINKGTHNVETIANCGSYLWHSNTYSTSGTYTYAYNNGSGCISADTLKLTVSAVPTNPTASTTQPTCSLATGTITVTSSTKGGLTFSINDLTYTNTRGVFSGVATGTYNLTAKNAAGCISSALVVTINAQPVTPSQPTATVIQPTCDVSTGTITVTSATAGLTFSINSTTYTNTTGIFLNVASGTYSLTARSGGGCVSSALTVTVLAQPAKPTAPTVTITQPTCIVTTGTITVSSSKTGLTFSINGSDYSNTTVIFTGLVSGNYNVTAKNTSGCVSILTVAVVNAVPSGSAAPTVSIIQPTCANITGTITVTSTLTGLTFSIDGSTYTNTSGVFVGVSSGTYNVTSKNVSGCISNATVAVVNAIPSGSAAPSVSITQPTCATATGTITVTSTLIGLTFSINSSTYTNTSGVFAGVSSGTYSVTAKNTSGCISSTTTATVNAQPSVPVAFSISGGGVYYTAINNAVPVNLSSSQTGVSYQLLFNGAASGTPVLGTGSALSFGNKTAAGTYTVVATNVNSSCITTMTGSAVITVSLFNVPLVRATPAIQTICSGNAITNIVITDVNNASGTTFTWTRDKTIEITGLASSGTGNVISGIPTNTTTLPQTTIVTITGTSSLGTSTITVSITVNPIPSITTQPSSKNAKAGDIVSFTLTATGLVTGYQWQMSTNNGSVWTSLTNAGVYSGVYTNTLNLTSVTMPMNGNVYRCVVTGQCSPTVTSTSATLSVKKSNVLIVKSTTVVNSTSLDVIVFPNPTTNVFNVQVTTNGSSDILNANVFDLQGRWIQSVKLIPNEKISLGSVLKPGVYFLEVNHGGEKKVVKVVKY